MPTVTAVALLGETCFDVFLNDVAYVMTELSRHWRDN